MVFIIFFLYSSLLYYLSDVIEDSFKDIYSKVEFHPTNGYTWKKELTHEDAEKGSEKESTNINSSSRYSKDQFKNSIDYLLTVGPNRKGVISEQTKLTKESILKHQKSPASILKNINGLHDNFTEIQKSQNRSIEKILKFKSPNPNQSFTNSSNGSVLDGSNNGPNSSFMSFGNSSDKLPDTPNPSLYNG
ncbi:hypothetical protein AYI69_g5220 [Smittium culicis]|uniref:Uncharacterized protein n=1 Tax=Smittium culicis TaxID=133412 RepID=A0A1R1Y7C7_9FUNG|nr:hypothetical protein AYI69_g5220 [Smittium culicis]